MAELKQYFNKADEKFSFVINGAVVTLVKKGDEIYLSDSQFSGLGKEIKDKLTDKNPKEVKVSLKEDKKVEFKK